MDALESGAKRIGMGHDARIEKVFMGGLQPKAFMKQQSELMAKTNQMQSKLLGIVDGMSKAEMEAFTKALEGSSSSKAKLVQNIIGQAQSARATSSDVFKTLQGRLFTKMKKKPQRAVHKTILKKSMLAIRKATSSSVGPDGEYANTHIHTNATNGRHEQKHLDHADATDGSSAITAMVSLLQFSALNRIKAMERRAFLSHAAKSSKCDVYSRAGCQVLHGHTGPSLHPG